MADVLKRKIIGQDKAVETVVRAIQRSRFHSLRRNIIAYQGHQA